MYTQPWSKAEPRGLAAEPAIAVATALLQQPAPSEHHTRLAAGLLARAAGLLPSRRNTSYKLETLAGLAPLLQAGMGLPDAARREILSAVEQFALASTEPELRVITLGVVAGTWASSPDGAPEAVRILGNAAESLVAIPNGTDRLVASAYLVPAMRVVLPHLVEPLIGGGLAGVTDPFRGSSITAEPLAALLDHWAPGAHPDVFGLGCLLDLSRRCLADTEFAGGSAGRLARELAGIGRPLLACDFLRQLWEPPLAQPALAVAMAAPAIAETHREQALDLFRQAAAAAGPESDQEEHSPAWLTSGIALGAARLGLWKEAGAALSRLAAEDRKDPLITCLAAAGEIADLQGEAVPATCDQLLHLADDLAPPDRAEVFAAAAGVLARAGRPEAEALAAACTGLCLAELPEGDTDDLWSLVAFGLTQDGDIDAACQTLDRMQWTSRRGATLARLARHCADDPVALDRIADAMGDVIGERHRGKLYEDGLISILNGLAPMAHQLPRRAVGLLNAAWDHIGTMQSPWNICRCAGPEITGRARLEPDEAVEHLEIVIAYLEQARERGHPVGLDGLQPVVKAAAAVATRAPARAVAIAPRLSVLLGESEEDISGPNHIRRVRGGHRSPRCRAAHDRPGGPHSRPGRGWRGRTPELPADDRRTHGRAILRAEPADHGDRRGGHRDRAAGGARRGRRGRPARSTARCGGEGAGGRRPARCAGGGDRGARPG
ncbi:MAG: hypothetical protein ACOY71_02350 [Gemmatimonadota bacterium]